MLELMRQLLLEPRRAWVTIAQQATPDRGPRVTERLVLAALPALGTLLAAAFHPHLRLPLYLLAVALGVFATTYALLFAFGWLVRTLANAFDSLGDPGLAHRVALYSMVPLLLAGLVASVPWFGAAAQLAAFGYAGYLFHLGSGALLGTPADKSVGFAAVAYLAAAIAGSVALTMVRWVLRATLLPLLPPA